MPLTCDYDYEYYADPDADLHELDRNRLSGLQRGIYASVIAGISGNDGF